MRETHRKVELTANILIIFTAVLLAAILVQKYFFFDAPTAPQSKSPPIGGKVSLAGFDWSKNDRNVLLVLSKYCRFCTESAEFYRRLIERTRDKNVRIVALLPQSREDAEKYLSELGISGIEIRQSPSFSFVNPNDFCERFISEWAEVVKSTPAHSVTIYFLCDT